LSNSSQQSEILSPQLTESQRAAITFGDGPLLIVAGPGAGKTDTIVRRAAYLIAERDVRPEAMLVTTFTNKATDELKDRLRLLIEERAQKVHVSTIHAFCQFVLEQYSSKHHWGAGFRVLDDREQFLFVYSRLRDLGLNRFPKARLGDFISDVIRFFNLSTEEHVNPQKLVKTVDKEGAGLLELKKDQPDALEEYQAVGRAYQRYCDLLLAEKVIDFSTLQTAVYTMLTEHPDVAESLRLQFRYILVDEYQDTNRIQVELFKVITQPRNNITAVGAGRQ
jgi:DNA helicase-2/ATP-dependent DNA helicase PcrA